MLKRARIWDCKFPDTRFFILIAAATHQYELRVIFFFNGIKQVIFDVMDTGKG